MYTIKEFRLFDINSCHYLLNRTLNAKITSETLRQILVTLDQQIKREITNEELNNLAEKHAIEVSELKHTLISKLRLIKPILSRKFPRIYIDIDDPLISRLLCDTLKSHYDISHDIPVQDTLSPPALLICYRQSYFHPDLNDIEKILPDKIYRISCGIVHDQLILDNVYFNQSGLPTHADHIRHLLAQQKNELIFYRQFMTKNIAHYPVLPLNDCQRGHIAYAVYQFAARFLDFDTPPVTFDELNWRWHVNLSTLDVRKEIAIHHAKEEANDAGSV
jgi:McbB family protein